MAYRFIPSRETNNIRIIFNALDTEKDGELEYIEFTENTRKIFEFELADKEMHRMLKNADFNKDGMI